MLTEYLYISHVNSDWLNAQAIRNSDNYCTARAMQGKINAIKIDASPIAQKEAP